MYQETAPGNEPEDPRSDQPIPDQNNEPTEAAPQQDEMGQELSRAEMPTSRRGFLASLALDAATLVGTAHLLGALPRSIEIRSDEVVDDIGRRPGNYRLTDSDLQFDSGQSFRNFGVEHVGSRFIREREHLLEAIKECDALLIEGCAGQEYFDFMAGLAFSEGKRVVRLESDISPMFSLGFVASQYGRLFMGLSNGLHFGRRFLGGLFGGEDPPPESALSVAERIEKKRGEEGASQEDYREIAQAAVETAQWDRKQARKEPSLSRTGLTWLTELGTRMFVGVPGIDTAWANGAYKSDDYSHLVDGRTVLMLGEVQDYVERNPTEKVLVISGDMHAIGFNYYLQDEAHQAEFKEKLEHYKSTYKPVFGGNASEELDPNAIRGLEELFGPGFFE